MTQAERSKTVTDALVERIAQQKPNWTVEVNLVFIDPRDAFELRILDKKDDLKFSYRANVVMLDFFEKKLKGSDQDQIYDKLTADLISIVEREFSKFSVQRQV